MNEQEREQALKIYQERRLQSAERAGDVLASPACFSFAQSA
jgi:hypothetical protein